MERWGNGTSKGTCHKMNRCKASKKMSWSFPVDIIEDKFASHYVRSFNAREWTPSCWSVISSQPVRAILESWGGVERSRKWTLIRVITSIDDRTCVYVYCIAIAFSWISVGVVCSWIRGSKSASAEDLAFSRHALAPATIGCWHWIECIFSLLGPNIWP